MVPGELIRAVRVEHGVTQAQLARRLGVTQPSVARMEAAGDSLTVTTLRRALTALGHDLDLRSAPTVRSYDETQLYGSLKRTPAERLQYMMAGYGLFRDFAAAAQRARDAT